MNTIQNQQNLQSGHILAANAALFEGTWTHLFGPGMAETTCRIVVDVTNDKLVGAQTPSPNGRSWINLPAAAKADLAESLFEANNVSANPAEWDLVEIESMPDWATSKQPAVVAPDANETRKKMLRTMALNAQREKRKLEKSPGQLAYERDLAAQPSYDGGARRPGWDRLGDIAKTSWERNPTDRNPPGR